MEVFKFRILKFMKLDKNCDANYGLDPRCLPLKILKACAVKSIKTMSHWLVNTLSGKDCAHLL